jgi:hypothetical protein
MAGRPKVGVAYAPSLLVSQGFSMEGDAMLTFRSSIPVVLIALAVVSFAGRLARADEESSPVKGKITLQGKPIAKGRIFIHLEKDQFVGAKIKDGEFAMDKVPVGEWIITVEGEGIPARYSDEEKTPLKVRVTAGGNKVSLELE